MKQKIKLLLILSFIFMQIQRAFAQDVTVNLAPIDGLDITPDNILNFQVVSQLKTAAHALVSGNIHYRNNAMNITYKFECTLQPGVNMIHTMGVHPQYIYSALALKELFEDYKKLPEGIYQYCVSVRPHYSSGEFGGNDENDCIYHKSSDVFLINLTDPENNARIYEWNPMLSWTVNYPFLAQLQYRLRVAPINKGQNTIMAITRNNPVYDEKNLTQLSQIYPLYAKPLVANQPYAWTVDAYYKGILLGGAEPWMFTIVEDSLWRGVSANQSYYDFAGHYSETAIHAIDTLKLKYQTYNTTDSLRFTLINSNADTIKFKTTVYGLKPGTNLIDLDIQSNTTLKHLNSYVLLIEAKNGKRFKVPFIYINPLFLKKTIR